MPIILRYLSCGVLSALIDLGVFSLCLKVWQLNYIWANVISFHIAIICGLLLQAKITFQSSRDSISLLKKYFKQYCLLQYGLLLIGTLCLYAFIHFAHIDALLAKILTMTTLAVMSFYAQKKIFKRA